MHKKPNCKFISQLQHETLYKQNKYLKQVEVVQLKKCRLSLEKVKHYVLDNYNEQVKYVGSMKLSLARSRSITLQCWSNCNQQVLTTPNCHPKN